MRSKAYVCGRSLVGIAGSSPVGGMDVCLLCIFCVVQVEVSAKGRSFVQVMDWTGLDALDAQPKAYVCGRSLVGIAGSSPVGGIDVCLLCIFCVVQVEVSAKGRSFVQVSPTRCECVCVIELMKRNDHPLYLY